MSDTTVDDAKAIAEQALKRGTFNFAEMISGRTYPRIEVALYLDEANALKLLDLAERQATATGDEVTRLEKEIERTKQILDKNRYTVIIRGFDIEERDELIAAAEERFPKEFEETTNAITGRLNKVEVPNPKRDEYFIDLLWHKSIESIKAPDGAEVEPMSVDDVAIWRKKLPLVPRTHIQEAINKAVVVKDWYEELVTEVF